MEKNINSCAKLNLQICYSKAKDYKIKTRIGRRNSLNLHSQFHSWTKSDFKFLFKNTRFRDRFDKQRKIIPVINNFLGGEMVQVRK